MGEASLVGGRLGFMIARRTASTTVTPARLGAVLAAGDVVALLNLSPHPEGGWFRETWRAEAPPGQRPAGTAIYFLLEAGQRSHWHRIDAVETWHFYAGDPLEVSLATGGSAVEPFVVGPDLAAGQRPQLVVPAATWQSAVPLGRWTLAGCTVSPAFDFAGFELAPAGWQPA
jgi:predicted cupin superfamily sugar epimerase